jgi:uncharacterized protein (TIGR02270 family)
MSVTSVPIPSVVQEHADESAALRNTRSYLVRAPHVRLRHLRRLDDRLASHLDGLAVAGDYGAGLATAALESPGTGQTFTATVRAIEERDVAGLNNLLSLAEASPASRAGLVSAFGWVPSVSLRGVTSALLGAPHAFWREVGLAACAMHQVDPGPVLAASLNERDAGADATLRSRALRVAASGGHTEFLAACLHAMRDENGACAWEATRAAVLLGDRREALDALRHIASTPGPWRARGLALLLAQVAPAEAHAALKALSQNPAEERLLVRGVGAGGDPQFVPWLIQKMQDEAVSRLAGESFSLIAGRDQAALGLERKPPDDAVQSPNDDPDDDDVAMHEDEGLPWPDHERIGAWWASHGHRFNVGIRCFMGAPPSSAHCLSILKTGFQRQRMAAAEHLCLLEPGARLFPTHAPAWRQQQWLDAMDEA